MTSFSDTDTVADLATWSYWPSAPNGPQDLARLVPLSDDARNAFRCVVQAAEDQSSLVPAYARNFIHWEHCDADSDELNYATPPTSAAVSGFFRLTREQSTNPAAPRWVFGCGQEGKTVELILDVPDNSHAVHSRHGTIIMQERSFVLIADKLQILVDGTLLSRRRTQPDPSTYRKTLRRGSTITIGLLHYRFDILDTGEMVSLSELGPHVRKVADGITPMFTPTPGAESDAMTLRGYTLTPAFDGGTYGTVYGATRTSDGREFVAKRATVSRGNTAAIVNEIKMLSRCDHANIVKLEDWFNPTPHEVKGRSKLPDVTEYWLIMEPAMQKTMVDLFRNSPLDRTTAVWTMLEQLSPALEWMHQNGIMHRDIKPANIGVDDRSSRKFILLDFGHACGQLESSDHMKGTVHYLAPEILDIKNNARGPGTRKRTYGPKADVWALGLSGAHLAIGSAGKALNASNISCYTELQSDKPLLRILEKMLAQLPERRISSANLVAHLGLTSAIGSAANSYPADLADTDSDC